MLANLPNDVPNPLKYLQEQVAAIDLLLEAGPEMQPRAEQELRTTVAVLSSKLPEAARAGRKLKFLHITSAKCVPAVLDAALADLRCAL